MSISNDATELLPNSTEHWCDDSVTAVRYASERLDLWDGLHTLIMTIIPEKSGECCVRTATIELSDGIEILVLSDGSLNT